MTEKRVQKVCHILLHLKLGEGNIYFFLAYASNDMHYLSI